MNLIIGSLLAGVVLQVTGLLLMVRGVKQLKQAAQAGDEKQWGKGEAGIVWGVIMTGLGLLIWWLWGYFYISALKDMESWGRPPWE